MPSKKRSATPRQSFSIPASLRTPLEEGSQVSISSEAEHAFFLRCHEFYRVLELADRTLDFMIETYSKYRTRDVFKETLSFRYFDSHEGLLAKAEPELATTLNSLFNLLHELRISLMHEDALPYTVKNRIQNELSLLKREWADFAEKLERRYGWRFKTFVS